MPDPEFILLGDAVWVDFINTARGRTADPPDGLPDPAAYHRWTKASKLPSDALAHPWDEILGFRALLLSVAEAVAEDHQPPPRPSTRSTAGWCRRRGTTSSRG